MNHLPVGGSNPATRPVGSKRRASSWPCYQALPSCSSYHRASCSAVSSACSSTSLLFPFTRKKLPLHHPVYRRHLPPCDLGDSVCLLETLQKV